MSILKIHSLVTLSALVTLGLATLAGCEGEDQDGLDSGLDTAVEAELADEADLADENHEQASALVPVYCSISVSSGGTATVSDGKGGSGTGTITISGTKREGTYANMTVKATMDGSSSSAYNKLSVSGVIYVDGVACKDSSGLPVAIGAVASSPSSVSGSATCYTKISYTDGDTHTVEVKDSKTTNARWEFNRSTGNSQVYGALSAEGMVVCGY